MRNYLIALNFNLDDDFQSHLLRLFSGKVHAAQADNPIIVKIPQINRLELIFVSYKTLTIFSWSTASKGLIDASCVDAKLCVRSKLMRTHITTS